MSANPHWEELPLNRWRVMDAVCEVCGCRPRDILSHTRQKELGHARKLLTLLLRDELDLSFTVIGPFMDRDHTSCMYNYRKAVELLERDSAFVALRDRAVL